MSRCLRWLVYVSAGAALIGILTFMAAGLWAFSSLGQAQVLVNGEAIEVSRGLSAVGVLVGVSGLVLAGVLLAVLPLVVACTIAVAVALALIAAATGLLLLAIAVAAVTSPIWLLVWVLRMQRRRPTLPPVTMAT